MLDLLADNYEVDVFLQNVWATNTSVLKKKNIRTIVVKGGGGLLSKLTGLLSSSLVRVKKYAGRKYDLYLSFEPHGFFLCKELFPEARPFYYSLELYFKDNHFNLEYPEDVMQKERNEIDTIKGLIIQSRERDALFRNEYELSDTVPTLLLPVTYLKPSVRGKSFLIRERFHLGKDTRIALHLGGIQEYHSCIELALTFARIDNWVLIFHGYHFGEYRDTLQDILANNSITNVIISDELYESIDDLDQLVMSCDLGLAWYNDMSPNFSTAGKSSGKISAYLRFGLPVIAKRYPSTMEAIEQTGCGICVNDFDEISPAVRKIADNYGYYSENCRREYDAVYWFENYRAKVIEFMGG